LGEEIGESSGEAPVRWIIDPIDGTKSFICGVPLYGTLIGIEIEGEASVGVASLPALGEVYYATVGGGAFCNGRRIEVSRTSDLSKSVILSSSDRSLRLDEDSARRYDHLVERTLFQRTWGDCYGHILVASGRAEAMLDPRVSVWDSAPLKVIVEEAGGVFTDWKGEPTIHGGSAISTNALLSESIRDILGIGTG
ncbi:MAG: inositol monophosphatase family protein, partial [Candidatus Kapaibacterium sp.]